MRRAGLTVDKVVRAAAEQADEGGFDQLSVSAVARRFGVADPSLYSHVQNLSDLRARVSALARAELADRLGAAVEGRAGRDALAAFAAAYRAYAVEHPGRMAAVEEPPAPTAGDGGDGARIVRATYAVFGAYGLVEPDLTDAVRFVRSTLHGFTDLERRAEFHHPAPVDDSFARIVDALDTTLGHWPVRPGAPPVTATRHRLAVDGGSMPYELRGSGPLLVLVGGPMTRAGYTGLAGELAEDHTVLTYDPLGFGESVRHGSGDLTPDALAGDVATLIDTLDAGPARLVGCSGGAVVALTVASARPDLVAGIVAHEPPLVRLLDDPGLPARVEGVRASFRAHGAAAGTASLARLVAAPGDDVEPRDGESASPGERAETDVPGDGGGSNPPGDGGETDRDVASFLGDLLVPTLTSAVDTSALAAIPDLVVAVGADSAGELPDRCARALAEQTHRPLVTVPGDHLAAATRPAEFAAAIRRIVSGTGRR